MLPIDTGIVCLPFESSFHAFLENLLRWAARSASENGEHEANAMQGRAHLLQLRAIERLVRFLESIAAVTKGRHRPACRCDENDDENVSPHGVRRP